MRSVANLKLRLRPMDDVHEVLVNILTTLEKSTIVPREAPDKKTRFWNVYKPHSEEYDREMYEKYNGSMNNSTVYVRCSYTFERGNVKRINANSSSAT